MPNGSPPALTGRAPRFPSQGMGWGALALGLIALSAGACIAWAFHQGLMARGGRGPGPWIGYGMAAMFGSSGAVLAARAVASLRRRNTGAHMRELFPREPWRWDRTWDPSGASDSGWGEAAHAFLGVGLLLIFLIPLHAVFLGGHAKLDGFAVVVPAVAIGLFDLAALLVLGVALHRTARALRHGRSSVRWNGFPIRVGSTAGFVVLPGRPASGAAEAVCTLRCLEESMERRAGDRNARFVCRALWSEERSIALGPDAGLAGIPLEFRVPADPGLGTRLHDGPARYWELEIVATRPGVDYRAAFLVPVYAD